MTNLDEEQKKVGMDFTAVRHHCDKADTVGPKIVLPQ